MTVASVEGSETSKGKFVRFVANKAKTPIAYQVWIRNSVIQSLGIQIGSVLALDPATVAIASNYKNGALVLDADGNETPSPVVYEYTNNEGVTFKYPNPRQNLDMRLKVVGCDNSGVKVLKAFNPL